MVKLREHIPFYLIILSCAFSACAAQKVIESPLGIMKGISFTEVSESSNSFPISPEGYIEKVDINSTIRVKINPLNLIPSTGETEDRSLDVLQVRLDSLNKMIETVTSYIRAVNSLKVLWDKVHNAEGDTVPDKEFEKKELSNTLKKRDELVPNIHNSLKSYFIVSRNISNLDSSIIKDRFKAFLRDSIHYRSIQDESTTRFIRNEIEKTKIEIGSERAKITGSAKQLKLRIQARLFPQGEAPIRFHVPGYDSLDAGDPSFIDHLSFQLDEKEKQKLKKVNEFNSEFAEVLNKLNSESAKFKQALTSIMNDFSGNLITVLEDFKSIPIEKDLITLVDSIKVQLESDSSKIDGSSTVKTNLKNLIIKLDSLESKGKVLQEIISELKSVLPTQGQDINSILINFPQNKIKSDTVAYFKDKITVLLGEENDLSLPGLIMDIEQLASKIEIDKSLNDSIRREFSDFTQKKLVILRNTVDGIINNTSPLKKLVNLSVQIKENFSNGINLSNIVHGEQSINVPLEEVQDTELHLFRTARHKGDLIEFSAKLLDDNGSVVSEGSKFFKVEKFGLNANVSGNLVFIKRDANLSAERKVNFVAAPAMSFTYKFNSRQKSGFGKFWSIIDPGFGMNIAALNFNSAGMEIGVGPIITFFGNIISGGCGYNLQTTENKKYWILGVGLFELFQSMYNPSAQLAAPTN